MLADGQTLALGNHNNRPVQDLSNRFVGGSLDCKTVYPQTFGSVADGTADPALFKKVECVVLEDEEVDEVGRRRRADAVPAVWRRSSYVVEEGGRYAEDVVGRGGRGRTEEEEEEELCGGARTRRRTRSDGGGGGGGGANYVEEDKGGG